MIPADHRIRNLRFALPRPDPGPATESMPSDMATVLRTGMPASFQGLSVALGKHLLKVDSLAAIPGTVVLGTLSLAICIAFGRQRTHQNAQLLVQDPGAE